MLDEYLEKKMNLAFEYMQNDSELALKLFDEILEIEPDNINALNGKGSTLLKLNQDNEAEKYFNKSLSLCENPSALINKGILCKNRNDYEDALYYFNKSVHLNPDLNNIISILKNEIYELNDNNLSSYTSNANKYIKKAKLYKKDNKLWDALDCYEFAIIEDHTCKTSVIPLINEIKHILHNQFLFKTPQFENTELDRLKIQSLKSLLIEENPKKALTLMNLILDIDENDVDTLNHKGAILFLFDKNHDAIKCFDRCLKIDENYYYSLFNKGLVLRRMNELKKALKCFNELLKITECEEKVKPYKLEILNKIK